MEDSPLYPTYNHTDIPHRVFHFIYLLVPEPLVRIMAAKCYLSETKVPITSNSRNEYSRGHIFSNFFLWFEIDRFFRDPAHLACISLARVWRMRAMRKYRRHPDLTDEEVAVLSRVELEL